MESIPDLIEKSYRQPGFGIDLSLLRDPMHPLNRNYFRELANYEFARRFFRPVRLLVKNAGQVAAHRVQVEIAIPRETGVAVIETSEFPEAPKRRLNLYGRSVLDDIRAGALRSPGEVCIDKNDERFRVEIDCGDLQPGRRVWSDQFYIGKFDRGELALRGQVFAENLPQPKEFTLNVSADITKTEMTVQQITALPDSSVEHD